MAIRKMGEHQQYQTGIGTVQPTSDDQSDPQSPHFEPKKFASKGVFAASKRNKD